MNLRIHWKVTTVILIALVLTAGGLAWAAKPIMITSEPAGAFIKINDQNMGNTPVSYEFNFRKTPVYYVEASKEGYFQYIITIEDGSEAIKKKALKMVLKENPAWKVTAESSATNTWLRIHINPFLTADDVWQKLVDAVTSSYDSLEQMDVKSGYLRSVATVREFEGPKGVFYIRTQFVAAISSTDPLVYKVKIASETRRKDQEAWSPYERVFTKDAQLIEELQSRLSKK